MAVSVLQLPPPQRPRSGSYLLGAPDVPPRRPYLAVAGHSYPYGLTNSRGHYLHSAAQLGPSTGYGRSLTTCLLPPSFRAALPHFALTSPRAPLSRSSTDSTARLCCKPATLRVFIYALSFNSALQSTAMPLKTVHISAHPLLLIPGVSNIYCLKHGFVDLYSVVVNGSPRMY